MKHSGETGPLLCKRKVVRIRTPGFGFAAKLFSLRWKNHTLLPLHLHFMQNRVEIQANGNANVKFSRCIWHLLKLSAVRREPHSRHTNLRPCPLCL